jgi:hypothetical protein
MSRQAWSKLATKRNYIKLSLWVVLHYQLTISDYFFLLAAMMVLLSFLGPLMTAQQSTWYKKSARRYEKRLACWLTGFSSCALLGKSAGHSHVILQQIIVYLVSSVPRGLKPSMWVFYACQ